MVAKFDEFATVLKASGNSMTAARRRVFEMLAQHDSLSMPELIAHCSPVDRASVYRAVELFESIGIVTRVYMGWKYRLELSEHFTHHHHHLTCVKCGKIVKIEEGPKVEAAIVAMTRKAGFVPDSHQLEIKGICEACQ